MRDRIRAFNKRFLNRLTGRIARSAHGPFAIIEHVGRRSGKPYQTPIIVVPAAGAFVIALTYGTEVDWYKNVLAAGRCKVLWHRQMYEVEKIEVLEVSAALPLFSRPEQIILRLLDIRDFARLIYHGSASEASST